MEFWQQKPGTTSEVKQLEKNWKNWKKQRNRDGEVRIQHEANTVQRLIQGQNTMDRIQWTDMQQVLENQGATVSFGRSNCRVIRIGSEDRRKRTHDL